MASGLTTPLLSSRPAGWRLFWGQVQVYAAPADDATVVWSESQSRPFFSTRMQRSDLMSVCVCRMRVREHKKQDRKQQQAAHKSRSQEQQRMTSSHAAEAQARLNINLRDIITFFQSNGIQEHSVQLLEGFIEKKQALDFLNLADGYGKCMAFLNHDELIEKLLKSYLALIDGYIIERKITSKRVKMLKEDKKSDPDVLARQEKLMEDIDTRKATASAACVRFRTMSAIPLEMFRDDGFDGVKYMKQIADHKKVLLSKPGGLAAARAAGEVH